MAYAPTRRDQKNALGRPSANCAEGIVLTRYGFGKKVRLSSRRMFEEILKDEKDHADEIADFSTQSTQRQARPSSSLSAIQ